jgi:hypothetical protein
MLAQPVDPRDQRWEVPKPIYRVYFWERQAPERTDSGWTSNEWRLEDTDIDEVLEWAQAKAASRRFVVYAEVTGGQPDGLGLVRLVGTDPTDDQARSPGPATRLPLGQPADSVRPGARPNRRAPTARDVTARRDKTPGT